MNEGWTFVAIAAKRRCTAWNQDGPHNPAGLPFGAEVPRPLGPLAPLGYLKSLETKQRLGTNAGFAVEKLAPRTSFEKFSLQRDDRTLV